MVLNPRQWKWILGLIGLLIVVGSSLSTGYIVKVLAEEEKQKVTDWRFALEQLSEMTDEEAGCDITLHRQILEGNTTVPLVLVNDAGEVMSGRNFGDALDEDTSYLAGVVRDLQNSGQVPIGPENSRVYYQESTLLRALRYYPYIQLTLVALFVGLVYLALSSMRRAEQNRVWVGMAKETAHQLGTPISAIMAWVEYLRAEYEDNAELTDVADELSRDVERLQLVAERFNKIGSTPELAPVAVGDTIHRVYDYMVKRAPRKVRFRVAVDDGTAAAPIAINRELFEWVIENLVRNALDAMDGAGELVIGADTKDGFVEIEVSDTGKGIPNSKHRAVFRPGYTTKSRGWGLGLSLAKRIVEEYHGGRIFVKQSAIGRGTTFAVRIPLADDELSLPQASTPAAAVRP